MKATEQDTIYIDVGDPALNSRAFKTKKAEEATKKRFYLAEALAGAVETKETLNISWWQLMLSGLSTAKGEGGLSMRDQMRYAAQTARGEKLMFEGDENVGIMLIGQVIGGIKDIPTCREIIERTVAEAEEMLKAKANCVA